MPRVKWYQKKISGGNSAKRAWGNPRLIGISSLTRFRSTNSANWGNILSPLWRLHLFLVYVGLINGLFESEQFSMSTLILMNLRACWYMKICLSHLKLHLRMCSDLGYLIDWRHLFRSAAVKNKCFILQKIRVFLYTWVTS